MSPIILAAFIGCLAAIAQTPERKVVNNNIIISDHDPKVRIELPKSVWYVGVDRFVLQDIADCELYAFVEVDDQKNVQRLYWIQFEDYLPSKPDLQHHYESPRHMTIGGFRFYVDTWVKRTNENITAGSDEDHIVALILSRGYKNIRLDLICTIAHPPVSTFRVSVPLPDAELSSPKVRRATVSIFSTCELRERMESASIDAMC